MNMRDIINSFENATNECVQIQNVYPTHNIQMNISVSFDDGTNLQKTFDNPEEFVQYKEYIQSLPNVISYNFVTTESMFIEHNQPSPPETSCV